MFRFTAAVLVLVAGTAAAASAPDLSGEWQLTTVSFGIERHQRLTLKADGAALSGSVRRGGKNVPISGRIDGADVRWEFTGGDGEKVTYAGRRDGEKLSGSVTETGGSPWGEAPPPTWRAVRMATDRPSQPRVLDFAPTEFHRVFSASIPPALRIWPGDVVRTKTVDAGGVDEHGKARVAGGNPQTGPFYVEGAMPGDVVAVHLRSLRLNRKTATSDDAIVYRGLTNSYASEHKDDKHDDVVWALDPVKGTAAPAKPSPRLAHLSVPVSPMLGCVGVAPWPGGAPVRTGDSGFFGGNMDFSEIKEGATVLLPVLQPGALLYLGDGHALQGDGELNGNALETSLDVEFSVDVLRETSIGGPRVTTDDALISVGLAGSLDEAFREATSDLLSWLEKDYGLTGAEAAILLGATAEYRISEVADRNAGVTAKIRRRYLPEKPAK